MHVITDIKYMERLTILCNDDEEQYGQLMWRSSNFIDLTVKVIQWSPIKSFNILVFDSVWIIQ